MNENLKTGTEVYNGHKTSYTKKRQKIWYEPMADYYIDLAEELNDKSKTREAINAAKGIVSDDVMKEVLAQINDKNMKVKAKELNLLDDVDIITPIKERYMGEFVRTPNFYTCTLQGEDITLAIRHKVQKKVFALFQSKLKVKIDDMVKEEEAKQKAEMEAQQAQTDANPMEAQEANAQTTPAQRGQVEPEISAEETVMAGIDIKKEVEAIKTKFYSDEASKAKQIVEFFVAEARFEEMMYQLFYYFWATEEAYVEFDPEVSHLGMAIVHPEDYLRVPANQSVMVEDDDAGVIRRKVTIKDILDKHSKSLSKDDIDYLESLMTTHNAGNPVYASATNILEGYSNDSDMYTLVKKALGTNEKSIFANDVNSVWEYKYFYKTKRKVGILHKLDEQGLPTTMVVGDDYKLNIEYGDLSIDWEWDDEVWVGYRFGNGNGVGVYIKPEPILVQRDELENRNTCKIPVIGIQGLLYDFGRKPIASRMLSHQALYIILTNKYRKEMAKFHGFVNLIAESILSDSSEFTQTSRLEYMYKDNLLIFNDAETDVNTLQALRTIGNTGQGDYIRTIAEMRQNVKAEAWDLANMNAERFGNIDVKGGKGNTEEAIRRVSTGSVLMFTMFDMLKERLYQAMSDYGRIVYIDGIKQQYNAAQGMVDIDMNHEELISSDIGVHFTVNTLEREKIDSIRNAIVSNSIQTGSTLDAIDALKHEDLESLRKYAEKLQTAKDDREERMAQQEQEASKYVEDRKNELEDKKIAASKEEVDTKGKYDLLAKDKDIYAVMLKLQHEKDMVEAGYDSDGDGTPDSYKGKDLTPEMQFLEEEIKRQTLELTKAKVKNEKLKPQQMAAKQTATKK